MAPLLLPLSWGARASRPALRNASIALARLAMHGHVLAMADEDAHVSGKAMIRPALDALERLFKERDTLMNKMVATVLANWARIPQLAASILQRAVRMLVPLSNTYVRTSTLFFKLSIANLFAS